MFYLDSIQSCQIPVDVTVQVQGEDTVDEVLVPTSFFEAILVASQSDESFPHLSVQALNQSYTKEVEVIKVEFNDNSNDELVDPPKGLFYIIL